MCFKGLDSVMCTFCNRVQSAIHRTNNIGYWIAQGRHKLLLDRRGNIKYTIFSVTASKPYSKTIPIKSLCIAKNLSVTQGLAAVNRTWHNSLPEGKSRPCNLKVIEKILTAFP